MHISALLPGCAKMLSRSTRMRGILYVLKAIHTGHISMLKSELIRKRISAILEKKIVLPTLFFYN